MSAADLLTICGPIILNPPMPDDWRSILATRKYSDGRTWYEAWRSEMKNIVDDIAARKTWKLQRQRLIHFRVAAATWIALHRAVGGEPRVALWRSYVEGIGDFATNPESLWSTLLAKAFYFAALQNAVLSLLGDASYATGKALDRHLEALTTMRQHAIDKGVVLDRGILDLDETDPDLAEWLMHTRNTKVYPEDMKLFGFLGELAECIKTGSVQEDAMATRWVELCDGVNAQIEAMRVKSHLLGKSPRRVVDVAAVLDGWRAIYQSTDTNLDTTRYVPGSVPTWAQWSGSPWVAAREQRLKDLEEQKLPVSDECWLHLSLPPGWEPQHENEHYSAQQYGRWSSETEWEPPPGRKPNSWREAVD